MTRQREIDERIAVDYLLPDGTRDDAQAIADLGWMRVETKKVIADIRRTSQTILDFYARQDRERRWLAAKRIVWRSLPWYRRWWVGKP